MASRAAAARARDRRRAPPARVRRRHVDASVCSRRASSTAAHSPPVSRAVVPAVGVYPRSSITCARHAASPHSRKSPSAPSHRTALRPRGLGAHRRALAAEEGPIRARELGGRTREAGALRVVGRRRVRRGEAATALARALPSCVSRRAATAGAAGRPPRTRGPRTRRRRRGPSSRRRRGLDGVAHLLPRPRPHPARCSGTRARIKAERRVHLPHELHSKWRCPMSWTARRLVCAGAVRPMPPNAFGVPTPAAVGRQKQRRRRSGSGLASSARPSRSRSVGRARRPENDPPVDQEDGARLGRQILLARALLPVALDRRHRHAEAAVRRAHGCRIDPRASCSRGRDVGSGGNHAAVGARAASRAAPRSAARGQTTSQRESSTPRTRASSRAPRRA